MNVNEKLIECYKNDNVLIKTYYQTKDEKGKMVNVEGIVNPIRIDNRQEMSPTDDQSSYPACAGFSACTLIESIYFKQTGKLIQLDSKQVYARAKQIDGQIGMEGTYLECSLQAALELIDIDSIKNGKINLFYNDKTRDTIELTKFLIHKYGFLQVGFQIDEAWYRCNNDDCIIKTGGAKLGGHAVNVVGYDQDYVYILNQWGTGWGAKGYAQMPWNIYLQELMYGAYISNITY